MKSVRRLRPGCVAIVRDLVTRILPSWPAVELDAGQQRQIEGEITAYVVEQIEAMPSFLRSPYVVALLAFGWLPFLRYARSFGALPPATQASYLAWWSDAPLAAMRDFVRLIRSTALLAYFDHALIAARLEALRQQASALGAANTAAHG